MNRFTRPLIFSMAILGISVFSSAQSSDISASGRSAKGSGAVFVMTNNAARNQVIAYDRAADGSLGEATPYDTHGRGSGGTTDPLESQGSLTLSQDHSLLFAVNAGSGDVSVFSVHKANLTLLNKTPSGGAQPSAIAEHGGLNEDDTHTALLVSLAGMQPETVKTQVLNQQVAPTIIKALGFNPNELQAVKTEQIQVLPFLFGSN